MSNEENKAGSKNSAIKQAIFLVVGIVLGILLAGSAALFFGRNIWNEKEDMALTINELVEQKNELDEELAALKASKAEVDKQVDAAKSENADLEKQVESYETQTADLDKQIETLETQKTELETRIASLTQQLKSQSSVEKVAVVYTDAEGQVLKVLTINKGANVDAKDIPTVPAKEGYNAVGWSHDGKNVQSNLTITPVYVAETYNVNYILGYYKEENINEYYTGNHGTYQLDAMVSGGTLMTCELKVMIQAKTSYMYQGTPVAIIGELEYAGKTYMITETATGYGTVIDTTCTEVGYWYDTELYLNDLYFDYHPTENYLYKYQDYTITAEGATFALAGLHYTLDRYTKKITCVETNEEAASVYKYQLNFGSLDYIVTTETFVQRGNEQAQLNYSFEDYKLTLGADECYVDFENLHTYTLQTTDSMEWANATNRPFPTTYTYGETLQMTYGTEYMGPRVSGYTYYPVRYSVFCPEYIMITEARYSDDWVWKNPSGDVTIITTIKHNPG